MLLNASNTSTIQYFIRLASGQEIGPYGSYDHAQSSAATMPVVEGSAPQIFPKTTSGQQVLFG